MSEAVIIALVTLVGVTITAVFSYLSARHSRQVNRAVNQVSEGEPRILELVQDIHGRQEVMELKFGGKLDAIYRELTEADSHFLNREEILRLWHEDHGDRT